jgi:hypothetical protein
MIALIKQYEAGKPKQHPVGVTAMWPNGWNPDMFSSQADWISPNTSDADYMGDPPAASGNKVIIADTDHLCGVCGDRSWVWKSFTRGENVIYMDVYDGAAYGCGAQGFNPNDPVFVSARKNMGYTLTYAHRMSLENVRPRPNLCSTGYCLTNLTAGNPQFLIYAPNGGAITVDLSAASGALDIEWLNPSNGSITSGGTASGGSNRRFTPPFSGDAVLYLYKKASTLRIYLPLAESHP